VAADKLPAQVQSNSWGPLFRGGVAEAQGQANRGWQIVLSTPDVTYLDMPYAHHPDERGLVWASRGTDLFKVFAFMPQNLPANASVMLDHAGRPSMLDDATPLDPGRGFIGLQGHLWSEMVRSPAIADQMIYPRLMALAERAWRRGGFEPDYQPGKVWRYGDGQVDQAKLAAEYQDFGSRLSAQFAAMDAAGVKYRLPPPGAQIVGGKLEANLDYGRFDILYRVQGGNWRLYAGPVAVSGKVELRTRSTDGKRFSRTVVVE
jgi:hexosaminidase